VLAANLFFSTLFLNTERIVSFDVLSVVTVKIGVFWNMTSCTDVLEDPAAFVIMLGEWFDDNGGDRVL
jgi:hypothetical protein